MTDKNFFTASHVDEQIEQLTNKDNIIHLLHAEHDQTPEQAEERLIQNLQAYHQVEKQRNAASLAQAWQRVAQRVAGDQELPSSANQVVLPESPRMLQEITPGVRHHISPRSQGSKLLRRLSMLAAVLVVAFLVGSMALVLTLSHPKSTNSVSSHNHSPIIAHTPTALLGKTISTKIGAFNDLTWSPDSKRVAAITYTPSSSSSSNDLEIWDAADGKHFMVTTLPGNDFEERPAISLAWSPNSQLLAVATYVNVLLVDSQTGQIVRSYPSTVASITATPSTGKVPLVSMLPASGPPISFWTTTWSPDGRLMASAHDLVHNGAFVGAGMIQVWNPQTGANMFSLPIDGNEVVEDLAWSSDGQYLAAQVLTSSSLFIEVWSVLTHQMISKIATSSTFIAWQPFSHNIAFSMPGASDYPYLNTLEIWNAVTKTLVKQYMVSDAYNSLLVWSPDGKQLAYLGLPYGQYGGIFPEDVTVNILDVANGQTIFIYKGHTGYIESLAWSPDGKDIVSCDNFAAKVWLAAN